MYNHGLISFLQAKSLNQKEAINKFLEAQGITSFNAKNHNRVNDYIEENWERFASFVDRSIKTGVLKGSAVKLNTYYDEQRQLRDTIRGEFTSIELSKEELLIISVPRHEFGPIHSLIAKNGLKTPRKDMSYVSKKLQLLPVVNLLKEHNLLKQAVEVILAKRAEPSDAL